MRLLGALAIVVLTQLGCSNADQVTVPNLHQMTAMDAYSELRASGLKVEIDGRFSVTPNRQSWVEGQAPEAGNDVDVGSVVTIHPGYGPIGLLAVRREQMKPIVVPPVVGEGLDVAARMLDDAGLIWDAPDVGPLEPTDAPTLNSNFEVARTATEPGSRYDQATRGIRPLRVWVRLADE